MTHRSLDMTDHLFSLPFTEVLTQEIHDWLSRLKSEAKRSNRQFSIQDEKTKLAGLLGVTLRQFDRYLAGETPFPAAKLSDLCRYIGSNKIVDWIRFQIEGLKQAADVTELDRFNIVEEQQRNVNEASEAFLAASKLFSEKPTLENLKNLERETFEAISQMYRVLFIARDQYAARSKIRKIQ